MVPGARDGHSACVLAKSMFIFGGYEQLVSNLSNTYLAVCNKGSQNRFLQSRCIYYTAKKQRMYALFLFCIRDSTLNTHFFFLSTWPCET